MPLKKKLNQHITDIIRHIHVSVFKSWRLALLKIDNMKVRVVSFLYHFYYTILYLKILPHTHTHTHICIHMCLCVCVCVCVVNSHTQMYYNRYVYTHICICVYVPVYTHMYANECLALNLMGDLSFPPSRLPYSSPPYQATRESIWHVPSYQTPELSGPRTNYPIRYYQTSSPSTL